LKWYDFDGSAAGVARFGYLADHPSYTDVCNFFLYFARDLKKPIFVNSATGKWVEADSAAAGVARSGTFANKPSSSDIYVGFAYFCTDKQTTEGATDGIMIYHKGSGVWVDALGRTIS